MVTHKIFPNATDSAINTFTDSEHYCYIPTGTPKGILGFFCPGSGAKPRASQNFAETMAALGYHWVNVMYVDSGDQSKCNLAGGSDPSGYLERACDENLYGTDLSPLFGVNVANSFQNRVNKLLIYLNANFPTEGWGQYILADGTIDWTKVIIAGHSFGGDMATFIAKEKPVQKALLFSTPREICQNKYHAVITGINLSLYRFFCHVSDPGYAEGNTIKATMGVTDVEVIACDNTGIINQSLWNANLTTNRNIDIPSANYHKCTINDAQTPMSGGIPVFKSIWEAMITN